MTDLLSRDQIITSFQAQRRAVTASAYEWMTADARQRLGADPYWLAISQEDRDKAEASGAAMPGGGYPVLTCSGDNSVDSAISAVGRGSGNHNAIRKHIMTRAKSLGCSSKIPDNWNADGSLKDDASMAAAPPPPATDATPPAVADAPPKPDAAPPKPPVPTGKAPGEEKADAAVTEAIASAAEAIDRAIAAQKTDPGNDTDPVDKTMSTGLAQAKKLLASLTGSQEIDSGEAPAAAAPDKPPAPDAKPAPPAADAPPADPSKMATAPGLAPGNAQGVPGDADDSGPGPGDIEATVACENPNCGHLGASHADTADGENQGACGMNGCDCPGMVPPADQLATADNETGDDETTGGPDNTGGDSAPAPAKMAALADTPPAPDVAPTEAPAMSPPPSAQLPPWDPDPNVATGPEFTIPVAWIEGTPTGESLGRIIDPGVLTWRTPPIPFMWLDTSPHDPSGMSPNDPARLAGRVDSIQMVDGIGSAKGHFLTSMAYCAETLGEMGRMGVSIDVGGAQVAISGGAPLEIVSPGGPADFAGADDDEPAPILEHLIAGRIMGITACPFAALEGAYVVLGDGSNVTSAPLPKPTPEQAQMGLRFVDATPCVPCSEGTHAVTASGGPSKSGGPMHPPKAWFADPGFAKPGDDDRLKETLNADTGRPSGKYACPFTITASGQVYGHIAQWNVCHQGPRFRQNGQCLLAPRSRTGYAWFHGRAPVLTAEGEEIGVGRMTAGTGHAPEDASWSAARAINHYDHSGFTAAVVRAGEDNYGIWVAGALTPDATPEQVYKLRTCPPSGDWRPVGAGDELCAVLAVNEPGWPIVPIARATIDATTGKRLSLVAAGVPLFDLPAAPEVREAVTASAGPLDQVLVRMARADVRRRMAEARGR